MNPTTSNFEELTTHWSSADNLYGSGCQLDATASTIFEISFSNESNKFFAELIKNKQSSNSNDVTYIISKWKEIKPMDSRSKYTTIKQRKLTINGTESGIAFFLRKNITTNITQTAFFHGDSVTIYSVSQPRTETKESDYFVIDRWTITTSDSNDNQVSVAINVNILWKIHKAPIATIIKSKWLRFYQSRFDVWRNLMKRHIQQNKSDKTSLMAPFIGDWNKLNSIHSIKIMMHKIEYSDGSQFQVHVNPNTKEIVASYAKSTFKGKLFKHDHYDEIRWNNGSFWIKNGFQRFEGKYTYDQTRQMYIVDASGTITLPMTQRKVRFKVLEANTITYNMNKNIVHKGTLCYDKDNERSIKWDNGTLWERVNESREILENVEKEEKLEEIVTNKKTVEIEGEIDESEYSDFEHDFDICLKNGNVPSINIQNNDHFVLINDDEILGMKHEQDEHNTLDEWLLV